MKAGSRLTPVRRASAFALLSLGCVVVLLARRPDLIATPQLYAEDGVIFYRDALLYGAAALTQSYAGYHHLVPRLVALVASSLPVAAAPASFVGLTLALEGVSCALIAPLLRGLVASPSLRWTTAAVVAAAVPADEIIGSIANVQWYLHLPLFVAAVVPLERRWSRNAARVAAVIVGATTPQGLLLAPVAAFVWWRRPIGRDPWIATLYAVASLLNVVTAAGNDASKRTADLAQAIPATLAYRVAEPMLFGEAITRTLAHLNAAGAVIGIALTAAALIAAWRLCGTTMALCAAYAIVVPVVFVLITRSLPGASLVGYDFFGADRYFVAPCSAMAVLGALIVQAMPAAVRGVALVAVVLIVSANLRVDRPPDERWDRTSGGIAAWLVARDAGGPAANAAAAIPPRMSIVLPACARGAHGGWLPLCPL